MIEAYRRVGDADAINYGSFSPYLLSHSFGAKVRVPGVDLPPDQLWQVVETELMTREDYDFILDIGWKTFFQEFLTKRVFDDAKVDLLPKNQESIDVLGLWAKQGIPVLSGGDVTTLFELLCGGRSLEKFFMDLMEIPDKVEAVMNKIVPHLAITVAKKVIKKGYPIAWVGGWRTAPSMISSAMWDRFVWPYFRRIVNEVINIGLTPLLHLDSNWERELGRFRDFPKGKIIAALDGDTDIFKAKEIIGDHLCLMGDIPANAKLENVQAMVRAAMDNK